MGAMAIDAQCADDPKVQRGCDEWRGYGIVGLRWVMQEGTYPTASSLRHDFSPIVRVLPARFIGLLVVVVLLPFGGLHGSPHASCRRAGLTPLG